MMINLDHCILLGKLTKTHGVKGQLVLHLEHMSFENIENMESVFIVIDNLPVPFFISSLQKLPPDELILGFDYIKTHEEAKKYTDCAVWIHADHAQEGTESRNILSSAGIESFKGYSVIDKNLGNLGTLNQVMDLKQNPLLQIIKDSCEILIPLHEEFVSRIDDGKKIIYVNTPDGLIDINSPDSSKKDIF
jgi:16S rRNA processing protein RimM